MIVVSDTTPLNYLVLIDAIDILPKLFGRIAIPASVIVELSHARTPFKVRQWVNDLPEWAIVQTVLKVDETISLGRGEQEAISLAGVLKADLMLIDDQKARKLAKARGLEAAGTLGVLEAASKKGLIDLKEAFVRLQATTFQVDHKLLESILARQSSG